MTGSPPARTLPPGGRSEARQTRFGRPRRGGVFWWGLWLVLAAAAATGIPRLRVSNSLDAWSPNHDASEGLRAYLVVGVEAQRSDLAEIERALARLPAVGRCFGPASEPALRLLGVTPGRLTRGEGGSYAGIYCFAGPGVDGRTLHDQAADALRSFAGAGEPFALGGSAAFTAALDRTSQERMPEILVGITVLGGLLLWRLSRSVRVALSGGAAIVLAMVVLLGSAGWHDVPLDMSLLLVPPLMISLGYSYAAHAGSRPDATRPLIACAVTSALGVAAFGAADLPSIRAFAAWGAVGVLIVWLAVLSLTPQPPRPPAAGRVERWLRARSLGAIRGRRAILLLAGMVVCALGPVVAPSIAVEAQPLRYFAEDHALRADTATLEGRLTGMLPFEVCEPPGVEARPRLESSPLIRKALEATAFTRGPGRTFWCLADNDSLEGLEPLFASWEADGLIVRGVAPQLLEVRRQMRRVAAASLPPMLLVGAVATGLLGRSWRAALGGLLATLAAVAALAAAAAALRCTVQMPALMTGAIGIGVGLDDAMHIVWLRRRRSLPGALRACFRASVGSSAIAALCMLAFALSPFRPTAQFGLLMAAILALAAVADMVILPALLAGPGLSRGPRYLH